MKHSLKIVVLLLSMFLTTQLIGLWVINQYSPTFDENGTATYNLPYGFSVPSETNPYSVLFSIIIALIFAIGLMLVLMKLGINGLLRGWFFIVIVIALGITFFAFFKLWIFNSVILYIITTVLATVLAYVKIFKRNILVHNLTELLIYPGIGVIFAALFTFSDQTLANSKIFGGIYSTLGISASAWSIITISLLLVLISIYDMYAVWHAGFMQKMAKYQIKNLKVFSGFFIPYLGKKEMDMINSASKNSKFKARGKKIKVNVAILGGGDVVFPIILAGVVLRSMGIISALFVTLGALLGLIYLFYTSKKGKFYPAMPFISAGCFLGLAAAYIFL